MDNGDLLSWLQQQQKATLKRKVEIMRDISAGMAYLISRGIFHRDLAARNVLLGQTY